MHTQERIKNGGHPALPAATTDEEMRMALRAAPGGRAVQVARRHNSPLLAVGGAPKGLFLIKEGVTATRLVGADDKNIILSFSGPGDVLFVEGLFFTDPKDPRAYTGRLVTITTDSVTGIEVPWDVSPQVSGVHAWAARQMVNEKRQHEESIFNMVHRSVEWRVAHLVYTLMQAYAQPLQGGRKILKFPFTHQNIAAAVGSTRETVTLTLGELRRKGIIEFEHRRIVVCDAKRLHETAHI